MAENIGKIVVSIEAEVAELRKGLAQAEQEFKKSAKRIEEQQKTLGTQIKQSWTELSSKITVVTAALHVGSGVLKGLTGAMRAFGEEGTSSAEKVGGAILAFGDAGIPIISDIINISEQLANVWLELTGAMDEIRLLTKEQARLDAFTKANKGAVLYKLSLQQILQVQKFMTQAATARAMGEEDVTAQFQLQRQSIEQGFATQNRLQDKAMEKGKLSEDKRWQLIRKRLFLQTEILLELDARENLAMDAWKQREAEKQKILDDIAARDKQRAIKDAQAKVDKTMDLQTRLNIMLAKQAGDEEKARTLAIEARYKKMLEGASKVNREIILQMKEIEMAAVGGAAPAETGGGTTGVSTAVGSFTVATGRTELKKQTSLLKRIARATEKLGEKGAGEVVILAA